jgi:hypothetical protein
MGGIRGNIAKSLVVDDMKLFVGECNDVVVVVDHEITKSKIENRHAANDPESSCIAHPTVRNEQALYRSRLNVPLR